MKKTILVLGSTGMIGHQVFNYLSSFEDYTVHNISYRKKLNKDTVLVDAQKTEVFIKVIKDCKPDYVINCIGLLIKDSEEDLKKAVYLNSLLPHLLSALCHEMNAKLIHMSTDCVFSGRKRKPYIETDEKDGLDTYAKTKGLGEIINEKHLTLRTSVIGPELKVDGNELFNWFMAQEGQIQGNRLAFWSGVTSLELSKVVKWVIDNNIKGLYHVTNGIPISKYELLCLFKKHTLSKISINPSDDFKVDKSFIDSRQEINLKIPSYDEMVFNMVEFIKQEKHLYSHYNI